MVAELAGTGRREEEVQTKKKRTMGGTHKLGEKKGSMPEGQNRTMPATFIEKTKFDGMLLYRGVDERKRCGVSLSRGKKTLLGGRVLQHLLMGGGKRDLHKVSN